MSVVLGCVSFLVLLSGLGSGSVAHHQVYCCLYKQSLDGGKRAWAPGTEGLSGVRWGVRIWVNIVWLLYTFAAPKVDWVIIITSVNFSLAACSVLALMLLAGPARRRWEKAIVGLALVSVPVMVTLLLLNRSFPQEHSQVFQFLLGIGNTGLMLLGEGSQIALLVLSRKPGRQTLLECSWSGCDWGLWAIYGWLRAQPELQWSCAAVSLFLWVRFALLVRYPRKRREFRNSLLGKSLRVLYWRIRGQQVVRLSW